MSNDIAAKIAKWMVTGNTGISSKAMAAVFLGVEPDETWERFGSHPSDPADFNRCLMLIKTIPELKTRLDEVGKLSDVWKKIIDNWDVLETTFIDEVGLDWSKGRSIPASKTYQLMKSLGC